MEGHRMDLFIELSEEEIGQSSRVTAALKIVLKEAKCF